MVDLVLLMQVPEIKISHATQVKASLQPVEILEKQAVELNSWNENGFSEWQQVPFLSFCRLALKISISVAKLLKLDEPGCSVPWSIERLDKISSKSFLELPHLRDFTGSI